jgi:hypothetical protein
VQEAERLPRAIVHGHRGDDALLGELDHLDAERPRKARDRNGVIPVWKERALYHEISDER